MFPGLAHICLGELAGFGLAPCLTACTACLHCLLIAVAEDLLAGLSAAGPDLAEVRLLNRRNKSWMVR